MRFYLFTLPIYLVLLAGALAIPGYVAFERVPPTWFHLALYGVSLFLLALAALMLGLIFVRSIFPQYWWEGQVAGNDVFEFDGVYFKGLRLTRIPNRLQRILFGVDERMRKWDLLFGLFFLVLMAPHLLGFSAAYDYFAVHFPERPRFHESLHQPMLSTLPVMREWNAQWSLSPELARQVERAVKEAGLRPRPNQQERFRRGELLLLKSFVPRSGVGDLYAESPAEAVRFNRGDGARAVEQLNLILERPDGVDAGTLGSAKALVGFFFLSDGNFADAEDTLTQALKGWEGVEKAPLSHWQVFLLAAQAALLNGNTDSASNVLNTVITTKGLPPHAYALAWEHAAEVARIHNDFAKAEEMLSKAQEMYQAGPDSSGTARVHLRRAALALEQGDRATASRELSTASSIATGAADAFTLNMVARLSLAFARS